MDDSVFTFAPLKLQAPGRNVKVVGCARYQLPMRPRISGKRRFRASGIDEAGDTITHPRSVAARYIRNAGQPASTRTSGEDGTFSACHFYVSEIRFTAKKGRLYLRVMVVKSPRIWFIRNDKPHRKNGARVPASDTPAGAFLSALC